MTDKELMQQALEALTAYDGTNGASQRKRVLAALRERLAQPQMQPCAGRKCGSTNPNLHSAECFEDYDKATGADSNRTWTQAHWTEYEHSIAAAEREACAALADKLEWSDNKGVASAIRARGVTHELLPRE